MDCYICGQETPDHALSCYTDTSNGYDHNMVCDNCLLTHAEKHYPGSHVHRLMYLSVNGIQFEPIE